jgi:hypothetical protein
LKAVPAAALALALLLVTGACGSAGGGGAARLSAFTPLAMGIELARGHTDVAFGLDGVTRPQELTAVRVDRSVAGAFATAPAGGPDDPARPGHQTVTTGTTVTDALRANPRVAVAINANFFWPCCQRPGAEPVGMSLFGLAIDHGAMVSDPRATQQKPDDRCAPVDTSAVPDGTSTGSTALVIGKGRPPYFAPASAVDPPIDPSAVDVAIAGGPQPVVASATACGPGDQYPPLAHVPGPPLLLSDGTISAAASADPPEQVAGRTFVGLSADRRYLFLATIDGSETSGAAFYDEASWLQLLGAADGLNLDGGGSSTMAVDEADLSPGADLQSPRCTGSGVRLLNDPHGVVVDGAVPACTERLVGNWLGVIPADR